MIRGVPCLRTALVLFVVGVPLDAQEKPSLSSTERAQALRLIQQLDGRSFAERDAASRALIELGPPVAGLIEEASRSASAEVRARAALILKQIHRPADIKSGFLDLAMRSDEKIDLDQGMWLISRILNPGVRRADLDRQLDEMANRVRENLGKGQDPRQLNPRLVVDALRKVLFEEYGFKGNVADYGNPDNSSLDRVLATRKGLPILLSEVVVSVGRRLRVPMVGLPMPGRFLVKYDGSQAPAGFSRDDIVIDPFGNGRVLERADLVQMFPGLNTDKPLEPATNREVLQRILNNLERHLFDRNRTDQAYLALELSRILDEHAPARETP